MSENTERMRIKHINTNRIEELENIKISAQKRAQIETGGVGIITLLCICFIVYSGYNTGNVKIATICIIIEMAISIFRIGSIIGRENDRKNAMKFMMKDELNLPGKYGDKYH